MSPTYNSRCPKCKKEEEYSSKISDMDSMRPFCSTCKGKDGKALQHVYAPIQNVGKGFQTVGAGWHGHSSRRDKKGY